MSSATIELGNFTRVRGTIRLTEHQQMASGSICDVTLGSCVEKV